MKRAYRLLLLLPALSLGLSGCLLTRVYSFKEQFCDYQRNFELLVDQSIRLKMRHPVLRDDDMVWLLGAEPTRRTKTGDRQEMVYVIEKDLAVPDPRYAIPVRLLFQRRQGDFRWTEGVLDRNLGSMITPGLIAETVSHTCDSETSVLDKNVTVDLSDLDPASIPRRTEIEQALGEPTRVVAERVVEYRYRLQTTQAGVEKSYARVWYADDGESVERLRFRYLRYRLDADFVTGLGVISIDL